MTYLVNVTEVYRADREAEAEMLINEAKENTTYTLTKYNCEHKERKVKGDVVDDWYKVTLVKSFTDEKEPNESVKIIYEG